MDYSKRWEIVEECGGGGQGKVYRVIDCNKFNIDKMIKPKILQAIKTFSAIAQREETINEKFELFRQAIGDLFKLEDLRNYGALKFLHKPQDARNANLAKDRIRREIQAMSTTSHPNLIKILDVDSDSEWFVSQFYPKGTLYENLDKFKGDFAKAIRAFRPLVEGVAQLHERKIVHRDIKPQNIFIGPDDNLILGDFGLVFFTDNKHTRISDTLENVGSRDWMPGWASGIQIERINPTFDAFCLGKVLWSMIAGSSFLRFWYFDKPDFNLEEKFQNNRLIRFANPLFKKCIVEFEENMSIRNATDLLKEIDKILSIIDNDADVLNSNSKRTCKVCGIGTYEVFVDLDSIKMRNFGIEPIGNHLMKIFVCSYCGNVQLFSFNADDDKRLTAWKQK